MELSNLLKNTDPSDLRAVLCAYGTESRHLFSKPGRDRWTLWSCALLESQSRDESKRKIKYQQLIAQTNELLKEENDAGSDDPLLSGNGRWALRFQDRELLEEIQKDVQRLFIGDDIIYAETATRILHLWSRLHHSTSYRQGMHELLRPILITAAVSEKPVDEADLYFMFEGLMIELECLYEHNDKPPPSSQDKRVTPSSTSFRSPLQKVCWDIHDRLLFRAAPDVKQKLEELIIEPQFYALRWLRCLFTREFTERYFLGFWDSLISQTYFEPTRNSLVEVASFFAVAMIMRVRSQILSATSQVEALEPLLRFPSFSSDQEAIQLAIQASRLRVLGDGPISNRTLNDEIPKQHRLGARLGYIVSELEAQLTADVSSRDDNKILQCLAQVKQIHDVLLDRLSEEDCYWGE